MTSTLNRWGDEKPKIGRMHLRYQRWGAWQPYWVPTVHVRRGGFNDCDAADTRWCYVPDAPNWSEIDD